MNVGFLQLPSNIEFEYIEPFFWDRQTLVIIYCGEDVGRNVMEHIRRLHKPTSHSKGTGYNIDVYTNLNYSISERDPAMRNIRCVYCNFDIMTSEEINKRFPDAYIVRVKKGSEHLVRPQYIGREIPQISGT